MILGSVPMPLPFMPVLLGFWFAMGRMPFGRHRGTKVRSLVGPYARFGILRAGSGPLGDATDLAGSRDQHGDWHRFTRTTSQEPTSLSTPHRRHE